MPKSLRWKLLAWHALWVLAMTIAFGMITHFSVARSVNQRVNEQLIELAQGLVARMTVQFDGKFVLELSPEQVEKFSQSGDGVFYYRIWNEGKAEVDSSDPSLLIPFTNELGARDRDGCREVVEAGPASSMVLVGRSMEPERSQLAQLDSAGALIGSVLLLVMFCGGWILVSKALSPIEKINSAALAISESNLSERIDTSKMETELSQLSETINEAFDRLENSFDRQTRFTADASHELRTPLSIVLAQAEFALRKSRSGDEYMESLHSVQDAAARMKAVVDGLLKLARFDSDQVTLNIEKFDMEEVVRETCRLLTPLAEAKKLSINLGLSSAIVQADRDRIAEAVSNLVSNAIQFSRYNGSINASLMAHGTDVLFSVSDSGVGISSSDLPHIFDRFFQVSEARQAGQGRGSGLGLAITKWIAEAHGGSISVSSEPSVGSTFVMRIKCQSA